MSDRLNTRERILEVSLRLFNERGYAATSLAEIAEGAGIAKGNLTYHFPTKYDLVLEFASRAREERRENVSKSRPGPLADEYVALLSGMEQARKFRFLMRDHAQFRKSSRARPLDPEALADAMEQLLGDSNARARIAEAGRARAQECFDARLVARQLSDWFEVALTRSEERCVSSP